MEVESNDSFGTATPTGVGQGFNFYASSGNYLDSGDNDYHYFYAFVGDTISINTSGSGFYADDVDTTVTLFNQFFTQVGFNDDSNGSLNSSLTYTAPAQGWYYFNVAGFGGDTGNYDITVSSTYTP